MPTIRLWLAVPALSYPAVSRRPNQSRIRPIRANSKVLGLELGCETSGPLYDNPNWRYRSADKISRINDVAALIYYRPFQTRHSRPQKNSSALFFFLSLFLQHPWLRNVHKKNHHDSIYGPDETLTDVFLIEKCNLTISFTLFPLFRSSAYWFFEDEIKNDG